MNDKRDIDASRKRFKYAIGLCCAAILGGSVSLGAMDWPSADAKPWMSFGQNDRGRPTVGFTFDSDEAVRAADAGEVVFSWDSSDDTNGFPSALGSWIAVDHGDGLVSVYGRLESFDAPMTKTLVEKGAVLGRSGATGWAESKGFYFSLLDRKEHCWVNPAMLSSSREDTKAPTLRSVILVSRDGTKISPAQVRYVRQGSYHVVVEAVDTENTRGSAFAPQRIECLVNGMAQGSLHLETIASVNGTLQIMQTPPIPANSAYASAPAFDLGEIRMVRGRTSLEIILRDANGNERSSTFSFIVE